MKILVSDCRHALRLYAQTPMASLVSIVVLAVGIAFVSSFLTLYVDLALKPDPGFEDGSDLVTIASADSSWIPFAVTRRISEEVTALDAIAGLRAMPGMPIGADGERAMIEFVTRAFFDQIRPELQLGRGISPAEHEVDAEPVIVISDQFWNERYGRDPDVLGTTLEIHASMTAEPAAESIEVRIVGVMAPEMTGINTPSYGPLDLWAPYESVLPILNDSQTPYQVALDRTGMRNFGRLRPGVSVRALAAELEARYADGIDGLDSKLDVYPGIVLSIAEQREAVEQLRMFLAGSVLLALVAAANVSLFLLARAPGRRRELAIRMSVGAPTKRLARQLATESAVLVIAGALLGLLMSYWLSNFLRGMDFLRSAQWIDASLFDWRVIGLAILFMLLLTMLVSLAPVLGLKRLGLSASASRVAARATLAQRIAGTAQIAIAMTFAGAAIAFIWFLTQLIFGDRGYEIDDRYTLAFLRGGATGPPMDPADRRTFLESVPGVRIATVTASPGTRPVRDPLDPSREIAVEFYTIDDQFLDVLGYRLLSGRAPTATDVGASLVNESLASSLFGRVDVAGEVLEFADADASITTILGVIADAAYTRHPAEEAAPTLFSNLPPPFFRSIVATDLPMADIAEQLRGLDDAQFANPFFDSLTRIWNERIAPDKARGLLTIVTAVLVVLISIFGFYGTQHYLVMAGRREYALRASIGAGPKRMGRLVFARGLTLGLPGMIIGAPLAFILVAWLRNEYLSREISPAVVTVAVSLSMVSLLLAASFGPARVARGTPPAAYLRED